MTECPSLTLLPPNPIVITAELIDSLIVNTYTRRVGTVVTVRCQPGLTLVGPSTVTCMQSGFWSAEPYCKMPNQETTATPTSNNDEKNTMILIIVLSIVGFLVTALILFICIALYWGRSGNKKDKHFRDSTEFYLEESSSHPYSLSRTGDDHHHKYPGTEVRNTNDDRKYRDYQNKSEEYDEQQDDDVNHHFGNYERRYQPKPDRRHIRCNHDTYTRDNYKMRQASSLNDLDDGKRYHIYKTERDEEKQVRDNRRDRYLWRRRSSLSNLNIPRPYYDSNWRTYDAVYYGEDNSPYI